jgi:hypothetical protein
MCYVSSLYNYEYKNSAGHQQLTPVILVTWEAEIGRIMVQAQPMQKVHEALSQPIAGHGTMSMSSQLLGRLRSGESRFKASPGSKVL